MLGCVCGCFDAGAAWGEVGAVGDRVDEPQGSLGVASSAVGVGIGGKGPGSSKLYQLARGCPVPAVLACNGEELAALSFCNNIE